MAPKLRELAICVVARTTGAEYEFHHHAPEFEKAGGSAAQVELVAAVAGYNMVARFLVALHVPPEA